MRIEMPSFHPIREQLWNLHPSNKGLRNHWAHESQGLYLVLTRRLLIKWKLKIMGCNLCLNSQSNCQDPQKGWWGWEASLIVEVNIVIFYWSSKDLIIIHSRKIFDDDIFQILILEAWIFYFLNFFIIAPRSTAKCPSGVEVGEEMNNWRVLLHQLQLWYLRTTYKQTEEWHTTDQAA
jgi:hypothetical protein